MPVFIYIFPQVYDQVRRDLLSSLESEDLKERLRGGELPSKDSLRTAASAARCVPKAPDTHDDINLESIPYKDGTAADFLLRRTRRPGEDKDLFLMGTPRTVRQFVSSKFKSGDATFSCTPKLFYQVFVFLCMTSNAYAISMFCLMPDK